jgi:hypothetical protein
MKLYHGTSGHRLDRILRYGLLPRGTSGRSNWNSNSIHSNPRCVYLTDSYSPYFAFNATRGDEPSCAVIEIDTDRLDQFDLYPDEDFLEQIGRDADGLPGTMKERTRHYRQRQFEYSPARPCRIPDQDGTTTWWRASLHYLGTCSHRGAIPPTAITRIVRWPHDLNLWMTHIWDPTITLINQKVMGDGYRALTAKLMEGDFVSREDIMARRKTDPVADFRDPLLMVIEGWQRIVP